MRLLIKLPGQRVLSLTLLPLAMACATTATPGTQPSTAVISPTDNPLFVAWPGPSGGVPPFDRVEVPLFQPALEAAMAQHILEIEQIARNPEPATFENTIVAMERAGHALDRVAAVYFVWSSNMSSPEFQPVEREMAPRLAAHSDRITQNAALFERIDAVYNSPDTLRLNPEQRRLAWRRYTSFVRSGARLDSASKARVAEINQRLAELFTSFNQNVLADESDQFLVLRDEAELAGLPQSVRDAAAEAAADREMPGAWVITNTRSSIAPFLTYSDRRDLRERAWRMFVSRGDMGSEHDNNAIISEILALRGERARLLGYATHAHWRLEDAMAGTPERATELMMGVWPAAVARVREEVADMQAIASAEGGGITIEPWDYRYYAEKVRAARYDLDENAIKPYLQLERLREAMFWVAGELFNFRFEPTTVPGFHPDVRVWEVTDRTTGRHVGLWYFDPYARSGKRSGAWMTAYRRQHRLDGEVTTLVSNNSNFVKGAPGEPVLISWNDAETLFHEFGHALHGLASNVTYPLLSGTAVARDYVEFPSQLLEHWLSTPEVLQRFALHYQTGEPIPQALVERIKRAATFNEGFRTVEYLISAVVDMRLHLVRDHPIDPAAFERTTLAELGMPREIVMRHRLPHFLHLFSSDSYSAGYYSYLWSDVLTADAAEAFMEASSFYDPAVAARLRQHIFSTGNTIDPAEAYRNFRGRDPAVEALMRKRGFANSVAEE